MAYLNNLRTILCTALMVSLVACGGGGGGGSSSSSSAATGIRILHGVIDASPVDLYSTQQGSIVQSARFADSTLYAELPTGSQDITLKPHLTTSAAIYTAPLEVQKNGHYSMLYFGSEAAFGVNASIISDEAGEIPEGLSAIKVAHALIGAAALSAQIGSQVIANAIPYGTASQYAYVAPGLQSVLTRRASDGRVVSQESYQLEAGKAYTILSSGEIDYLVVNRFLED